MANENTNPAGPASRACPTGYVLVNTEKRDTCELDGWQVIAETIDAARSAAADVFATYPSATHRVSCWWVDAPSTVPVPWSSAVRILRDGSVR